jgi:hypothetical protein
VTDILARNGINIRALALADTADFGIFRLIVNDPEKTKAVLKENGFTVAKNEVIAVVLPDRPGGLAGVLQSRRCFYVLAGRGSLITESSKFEYRNPKQY